MVFSLMNEAVRARRHWNRRVFLVGQIGEFGQIEVGFMGIFVLEQAGAGGLNLVMVTCIFAVGEDYGFPGLCCLAVAGNESTQTSATSP